MRAPLLFGASQLRAAIAARRPGSSYLRVFSFQAHRSSVGASRPDDPSVAVGPLNGYGQRHVGLSAMANELRLNVVGFPDSDVDERADLASDLATELRDLDAHEISPGPASRPPGAKGTALEWAQLVVGVAGALPPLIGAIEHWLVRHPGVSITLEIEGDQLAVTDLSPAERHELIETWMRRHGVE
jgi:hypothetical protein